MVRKLSLAVALALGIAPLGAHALGLGEINLKSALNQYLSADIELLSVEEGDLEDIRVSLASAEAFARANVDRPYILTKLDFKPVKQADGSSVIQLSSRDPIREPFLNFLVEVNWPKGKLVREYTVLLDPPVTLDRRPAPVQTPKAETRVTTTQSAGVQPQSVVSPSDVSWAGGKTTQPAAQAVGEYGPTKRNDTLWSIAKQVRHDGASMHQMMMALFRSNPEAFINSNINNLKTGQVLRIPERDEVLTLAQREAVNAYTKQVQEWQADRETVQTPAKPAETVAKAPEQGGDAIIPVSRDELKIATARPEGQGEAGPSEGDAPAKTLEQLRQDLLIAEEAKAGAIQESTELKSRLGDLESQLQDLQRLLELKNNQLAQLQATVAATGEQTEAMPADVVADSATTAVEEATGDQAEAAVTEGTAEQQPVEGEELEIAPPEEETADAQASTEAEPTTSEAEETAAPEAADAMATTEEVTPEPVAEIKPEVKPEPPKPEPKPAPKPKEQTLIEKVMGDTTILGGIIAVILVLLASLWVWISKRRSNRADFQESILVSTFDSDEDDELNAPDAPSQQTEETSFLSDFSPSDIDALQDETGEVDPLAEADVYIAYGRYQQAEELVRQAINKDPERLELKDKLAEILFATKNNDAFMSLAEEMKSQGVDSKNPDLWSKVASMGRQLLPEASLFAGVAAAVSASDDDASDASDFGDDLADEFNLDDLDDDATMVVNKAVDAAEDELDFDVDLGLDELNKGLNEDTSSIEALGDLGDLSDENKGDSIDLGLNLDEETTALDLEEIERMETSMDDALKDSDLDEITSPNVASSDDVDLGAFEEPTSEVIQLKVGDPQEDADVANLAADELDLGDLGDLDLSSFEEGTAEDSVETAAAMDDEVLSLDDVALDDESIQTDAPASDEEDEVSTKIDLARAYVDMGDPEGARDILNEVLEEGSDSQKLEAQEILDSMV